MSEITTTHNLAFESAPWELGKFMDTLYKTNHNWQQFRIGTCYGTWRDAGDAYEILNIINTNLGNGHFEDVMQWFEHSAKRDKKKFRIREVWNKKLKAHLVFKRGFNAVGDDDVEKEFEP